MAFNAAAHDAFFLNGPQMGLDAATRNRLALEGLNVVADFEDFKEDQLSAAIKNLRTTIPGVPAVVDPAIPAGDPGHILVPAVPPILPCIISARCALRLKVASIAYHYYIDTDRIPTPQNMNYTLVLKDFYVEWEALKKQAKEDKPAVPTLSKTMTPLKWLESFKDTLSRTYGVRGAPLSYITRDTVNVQPEAEAPLLPGCAYSAVAGSIVQELVNRLSHTHPLYRADNATLFSMIEEATRGTIYAPAIRPYARNKDGRSAYLSVISSHAGNDKWEDVQKTKTKFLINTKWNGKAYGLDKFTGLHRAAYVALEEASHHVDFQLPNEHTRVGYLLENIVSSDPDLRAALASIRANVNNMRDNFEAAVTFMLPTCPYARHAKGRNSGNETANISDVTLQNKSSTKTGVDLRWHTRKEYQALNKAQRAELYEWQQTKQGKKAKENAMKNNPKGTKTPTGKKKSGLKARIASLEKELEEKKDEEKSKKVSFDPSSASGEKMYSASEVCAMIEGSAKPNSRKHEEIEMEVAAAEVKAAQLKLQNVMKRSRS